ncbi:MAG TPA: PLP-dependent aminotransferase family protein [Acidisoma sp.]|jgi:GntR family transcriptional regulator/MocR family aminotransferase|nr:PLP-dependent aminotransferase family protein [Acidisoma sp.]
MVEIQPALVPMDRGAGDLEGQLYRGLRSRILGGALAAGAGLPSTRNLAISLGLARSTVVSAYERLKAEGYLETAAGRASRVAAIAPPRVGTMPARKRVSGDAEARAVVLPLAPGVPDLASFPSVVWGRLLAARARRMPVTDLGYGAPLGLPDLRAAILAHIAVSRGVVAEPDQLILFPSTRAAIALLAQVALRGAAPGTAHAWIEEPGYTSAQQILRDAGVSLVPIPVDENGMDVERASSRFPPRLIYVTPSHQYPTGATLSLARRLQLLDAARRAGALILEDDYDSEFQFDGRPIAALQGIDQAGVVAYIGTLSKVLAPGVRLAYAVLPPRLLPAAQQGVQRQGMAVPIHIQAAFLDFLREGHFRAHIRRMTPLYAARMAAFREAVLATCRPHLWPGSGAGGLQLALWFRDESTDDRLVAAVLRKAGYGAQPLSGMHLGETRSGLLCGIAGLPPERAAAAAAAIARAMPQARLISARP